MNPQLALSHLIRLEAAHGAEGAAERTGIAAGRIRSFLAGGPVSLSLDDLAGIAAAEKPQGVLLDHKSGEEARAAAVRAGAVRRRWRTRQGAA